MHPKTRAIIERHCAAVGAQPLLVTGPHRINSRKYMAIRHATILELWGEGCRQKHANGHAFAWSLNEIARQMRMNHTSVRHVLIKNGVYGESP